VRGPIGGRAAPGATRRNDARDDRQDPARIRARAQPARLHGRVPRVRMAAGTLGAHRIAGRSRPQHCLRGRRSPRAGRGSIPDCAALARQRWRAARDHVRRAGRRLESVCGRARRARRAKGRLGLQLARARAGALRRRARHAQASRAVLSAVLRVRPGADQDSPQPRPSTGAGHHRAALRAQGGGDPRARSVARARHFCGRGRRGAGHHRRIQLRSPGGAREPRVRNRRDLARGSRVVALHEWDHGDAQGRAARARSRADAPRDRPLRARSAPR